MSSVIEPSLVQADAAAVVRNLRCKLTAALARGVKIPGTEVLSGWWHLYVCPACAQLLRFDAAQPRRHECGHCGAVQIGNLTLDEAWLFEFNHSQLAAACEAAAIFEAEGDPAAADYAHAVLLGYARQYPEYPEHCRCWMNGRLGGHALDEAVFMTCLAELFDVLRAGGRLNAAETELVVTNMFLPAMALLRSQTNMVHNIHVWMAAAVYALAMATGRPDDRAFALEFLRKCLNEGVLPDGMWFEGSPHYHHYTMRALWAYAAAALRHRDTPLLEEDTLRKMCRPPLTLLLPDHQFACLNDGWPQNPVSDWAAAYEQANAMFGGFEPVLAYIYGVAGGTRDSGAALRFGPPRITAAPYVPPSVAAADGVASARRGGLIVIVKANPYGHGHDHPDKPSLNLFTADGAIAAADLGNPAYGSAAHEAWFRKREAHNTVWLDLPGIQPGNGHITRCEDLGPCTVIQAACDDTYPGVELRRTVIVGEGWVFDRTTVRAAQPVRAVWRFHASANLCDLRETGPREFLANPHLTRQRELAAAADGRLCACWQTAGAGRSLHVILWPDPNAPARFGAACGEAIPPAVPVAVLLTEAFGATLVFDAAFTLGPDAPMERTVEAGETTLSVAGAVGAIHLRLTDSGVQLLPA